MDEQIYRKILEDGKMQLAHELDAYISDLKDRTSDINNFLTFSELESKLSKVNDNFHSIISNATSKLLSNIDDKDLLKSKKLNI